MFPLADLRALLGCSPFSLTLKTFFLEQYHLTALPACKAFPDVVYFSIPDQGVSFLFDPIAPYQPKYSDTVETLQLDKLKLSAIDLYAGRGQQRSRTPFGASQLLPLSLDVASGKTLILTLDITGKELVEALGEPTKKGGGTSHVPIWLEWSALGLKVELDKSTGLEAWTHAASEAWTCVTLFQPISS